MNVRLVLHLRNLYNENDECEFNKTSATGYCKPFCALSNQYIRNILCQSNVLVLYPSF